MRLDGPRRLVLLADYVVEWEAGGFPRQRISVPAGYEFAGRVPRDSHLYRDETGAWVEAGHEWSRKESDRFFARNLRFCDISDGQRRNAYRAVRIGGWIPWRKAERRGAPPRPVPA